jgi:hypothetical protein
MAEFRKHKSEKPLVWGYSGWYYSIKYYGITFTFIDIEDLRKTGENISARKESWGRYSNQFGINLVLI